MSMATDEHTKGMLTINLHREVVNSDGDIVFLYANDNDERRLIAAWNATEGFGTEQLEDGMLKRVLADKNAEISCLQAEVAELLSALKRTLYNRHEQADILRIIAKYHDLLEARK